MGLCRVVLVCEGFRMPALTNVAPWPGPASESLQGRNPRGDWGCGCGGFMAIWASGMACAGALARSCEWIDGAGEHERRAVASASPVGWCRLGLGSTCVHGVRARRIVTG